MKTLCKCPKASIILSNHHSPCIPEPGQSALTAISQGNLRRGPWVGTPGLITQATSLWGWRQEEKDEGQGR